jgi:hypothetical protein
MRKLTLAACIAASAAAPTAFAAMIYKSTAF